MTRLSYHDLKLRNGSVTVLDGIDLEFSGPGVCALLGPSGVGKSSLLRTTQRLIENGDNGWRREGDVRVDGESLFSRRTSRQQVARRIGFIQQHPRMFAGSILANVEFALRYTTRLKRSEIRQRAEAVIEHVGLAGELPSLAFPAAKLSGGQKQRLAIARAIALEPPVLLMDEPTTSLDPPKAEQIEAVIRKIANERLVVVVTHDVSMARRIAGFAAFIARGPNGARIAASGAVPRVFEDPPDEVVRSFVESPHSITHSALSVGTRPTPPPPIQMPSTDMPSTEMPSDASGKPASLAEQRVQKLLRHALEVAGTRRPLRRLYLFVCGGNTLRSPLAEAFCNAEIARLLEIPIADIEQAEIRAISAGLTARPGTPRSTAVADVLERLRVPCSAQTARPLSQQLADQADVIFCMTRDQETSIVERFPDVAPKVRPLDPDGDIGDPHGATSLDVVALGSKIHTLVRERFVDDLVLHLPNA